MRTEDRCSAAKPKILFIVPLATWESPWDRTRVELGGVTIWNISASSNSGGFVGTASGFVGRLALIFAAARVSGKMRRANSVRREDA